MNYFDDFSGKELDWKDEPEYLTPREVMDLLCIGRNRFYRMVNSGELKGFRIGKLWRVRREEVERFAKEIR